MDDQDTKWRRNVVESFNRLSRVHERYRQTTDGRQHIANVNVSSRSLKSQTHYRPINNKTITPSDYAYRPRALGNIAR